MNLAAHKAVPVQLELGNEKPEKRDTAHYGDDSRRCSQRRALAATLQLYQSIRRASYIQGIALGVMSHDR